MTNILIIWYNYLAWQYSNRKNQKNFNNLNKCAIIRKVIEEVNYEKKKYRNVKPSDIAILVSRGEENDAVQKALNALGIKSVYFSDQSSVLNKKVKNKAL